MTKTGSDSDERDHYIIVWKAVVTLQAHCVVSVSEPWLLPQERRICSIWVGRVAWCGVGGSVMTLWYAVTGCDDCEHFSLCWWVSSDRLGDPSTSRPWKGKRHLCVSLTLLTCTLLSWWNGGNVSVWQAVPSRWTGLIVLTPARSQYSCLWLYSLGSRTTHYYSVSGQMEEERRFWWKPIDRRVLLFSCHIVIVSLL